MRTLAVVCGLVLALSACAPLGQDAVYVEWTGPINDAFAAKVKKDVWDAQALKTPRLVVRLMSPGGSVIWTLEALREIKAAQRAGLVVEIHGSTLVASGATFILGAGTKGRRFVHVQTLVLVHSIRTPGGFFEPPTCMDREAAAKKGGEDGKVIGVMLDLMVREYITLTGKSAEEVESWLVCGQEKVGDGILLLQLGLADDVEE